MAPRLLAQTKKLAAPYKVPFDTYLECSEGGHQGIKRLVIVCAIVHHKLHGSFYYRSEFKGTSGRCV